jgi:hypothetical protein
MQMFPLIKGAHDGRSYRGFSSNNFILSGCKCESQLLTVIGTVRFIRVMIVSCRSCVAMEGGHIHLAAEVLNSRRFYTLDL